MSTNVEREYPGADSRNITPCNHYCRMRTPDIVFVGNTSENENNDEHSIIVTINNDRRDVARTRDCRRVQKDTEK